MYLMLANKQEGKIPVFTYLLITTYFHSTYSYTCLNNPEELAKTTGL